MSKLRVIDGTHADEPCLIAEGAIALMQHVVDTYKPLTVGIVWQNHKGDGFEVHPNIPCLKFGLDRVLADIMHPDEEIDFE